MKKITIFLFLFTSILVNAQSFRLKGTVVGENNETLPGATILVKETNQGTSTDFDGKFNIKISKGIFTIQVSFIGYKTVNQKVSITENLEINVSLKPNETLLDEVLVSAVRVNADIPVTFSNLSKKEIAKRNLGQDIPVLMNYLPNVVSSSDAGAGVGYTYMNVRGSNSERINVTINGIPYNDAESQGTFWVNLGDFASSTQNLQLQRGVGTSTNGSGAFGASLNILTDAVSEEVFGEISNSFGSFNTRKHTVKFSTGKLNEHFEIAGRLSNIYSDGYVDRAFADLKSYFLQGTYTDESTLIKAITFGGKERTYQSWFGLDASQLEEDRRQNPYTYDNEVDDYGQDHYQLHWNEKWTEQWSTNLGLNYTKGKGFFEQFKEEEDASDFNNLIVDGSDVIVRRWLDNDFYVVNFNTNYKTEKLNLITGISYSNYKGDHFGEVIWGEGLAPNTNIRDRYYFSDATKNDFSIFAKANFEINEKLSGYLDLQGRFVSYQTKGLTSDRVDIDVDENFNFFNPKFGFTYQLNENNNLYASFAVANKEPNRNDFENGVSTAENLLDYELGWRLKSENVKLNINIYFMDYNNQLVLTGAIDDVGQAIRATSGSSYRLGLEIDADITLSDKFSIRPNASFSTNKNRDFFSTINGSLQDLGNTDITFSPNVVIGNIFTYKPLDNFQVSFLSKYVGEQLMSNLNSAVTSADVLNSFFTSDLNVVYQINTEKIFKSITLTALVNNIFNTEYVDRGYYGTFDYGDGNGGTITGDFAGFYPQATTNFLIGATLRF
ncbi:MAG: TonB-dependent receptor [Polaribacter sp.]|nr:TonB-dependent receptor [Polaribacter sp.]